MVCSSARAGRQGEVWPRRGKEQLVETAEKGLPGRAEARRGFEG